VQGLARIRGWLLSIKHEQEISNHFDQRLAEKEFGGKADEAESENKEEQEKDDRAYFRLHLGSTSNRMAMILSILAGKAPDGIKCSQDLPALGLDA
jgi:hypothetical protein